LLRTIESNLRQADDPDAQWTDAGWWFVWPALLLALPWFRRGWTMQW
jgi:Ca-activated chloride channel family protein